MVWNFDKDDEWKNTPKGSLSWNFSKGSWSGGSFNFTKDDEWKKNPEGPDEWNFTPSPDKRFYNEGDLIAGVYTLPTFNFTGIPCTPEHIPCGYWWRFPIYSNCYILTTRLYPLYVDEYVQATMDLVYGELRDLVIQYSFGPENIDITNQDLYSGELKQIVKTYSYEEDVNITDHDLVSGELKDIYKTYSIPVENVDITGQDLVSGELKDVYITYTYPFPEDVNITTQDLIGGILETA